MTSPSFPVRPLIAGAAILFASTLQAADAVLPDTNPFARESTLPYQYPPFDRIKDEHFAPAFAAGMAEQLKEVDAIANQSAAPSFDNTLVALEKSGVLLTRVNRAFSNLTGTVTNDTLRALEKDISPKLAAQSDAIRLNSALFARIESLHRQRDQLRLDPEAL